MLNSRKRKSSPEKSPGNLKMKKLKVSSKIFRSPSSSKGYSGAKAKLYKLLPEGYESMILTASTRVEDYIEGNEALFGCIRLPIVTKEDAMIWVRKFEKKTFTSYRTQKTWKNDPATGLFKRKFLCNYRLSNDPGGVYSCKACIIFTIKDAKEIQTNPDYYLRDYPSQVIIQFCHNHKIDPDEYLKNTRPSTELRVTFGSYFAKGHSPFSALICHKCDLHSSYGSEFYDVVSNGGICPSFNWCSREFEKLFMRKFVEPSSKELNEKLNEVVMQYNSRYQSECAVLSANCCVLSVATLLMKSIFKSGFGEDLITVRTFCTPKLIAKRQKVILFLCHTPIGSLPFGVIITFSDELDVICEGIKRLMTSLEGSSYSPKTIITDENLLTSKCLKKVFPQSQLIFNEFHMLQSIWRIIRLVCEDDNEEFQSLYNLFFITLNSETEEDFKSSFDSLLVYAEKYPKLSSFLKYFKLRSSAYVLYARPKVEFNTDVLNYTDSGTVILQDVSIKYGEFFNILQLFDFLTNNYVKHYERKLNKIVQGDLKGFFKTNFFVPLSKIADFTCEKISDTEFLVSLNDVKFFVNAELDTCTCQIAVYRGSCVHQYIVEKNLGLVPECYMPLEEDMLDIFKSILAYKHKPDSETSQSDALNADDSDEFSLVGSFSETAHDVENLGPLDEIFLAPSEIPEHFSEEEMSSLELSEYEDCNEDNEFLNDTGQYNRESGELEPIETFSRKQIDKLIMENTLALPSDQTVSSTSKVNQKVEGGNTMYRPAENKALSINDDSLVITTNVDGQASNEYTYGSDQLYEEVMTENDKKTAEIAEFLTNLPGTNNQNYASSTDPVVSASGKSTVGGNKDEVEVIEQLNTEIASTEIESISASGVIVMKNDEFFTQYRVMENGVLSVITDTDDEYSNRISSFPTSTTQNYIGDSYEEANLILMSPTDLFENSENIEVKEDASEDKDKINVLSTVVIKPPSEASVVSSSPMNLNKIKNKTVKNVKEDSNLGQTILKTAQQTIVSSSNEKTPQPLLITAPKSSSDYEFELASLSSKSTTQAVDTTTMELEDHVATNAYFEEADFTDCDSQQLANEHLADIAEMDSDALEELASHEYDVLEVPSEKSKLKETTEQVVKISPILHSESKELKRSIPIKSNVVKIWSRPQFEHLGPSEKKEKGLTRELTTAFSQLTDLAKKDDSLQQSVKKFLGKFKELGNSEKLISALESFGCEPVPIKQEIKSESGSSKSKGSVKARKSVDLSLKLPKKMITKKYKAAKPDFSDIEDHLPTEDGVSSSTSSDSESADSSAFEHYSDCRTSCSEFHSELESVGDLSETNSYEPKLPENPRKLETYIPNLKLPTGIKIKKIDSEKNLPSNIESDKSKAQVLIRQVQGSSKVLQNKLNIKPEAIKSIKEKNVNSIVFLQSKNSKFMPTTKKLENVLNKAKPLIKDSQIINPFSKISDVKVKEEHRYNLNLYDESNKSNKNVSAKEGVKQNEPTKTKDEKSVIKEEECLGPSIVGNDELSFIFNDSRFETVMEEEDKKIDEDNLSLMSALGGRYDSSDEDKTPIGDEVTHFDSYKDEKISHLDFSSKSSASIDISNANQGLSTSHSQLPRFVNITLPQMFYLIPKDVDPRTLMFINHNETLTKAMLGESALNGSSTDLGCSLVLPAKAKMESGNLSNYNNRSSKKMKKKDDDVDIKPSAIKTKTRKRKAIDVESKLFDKQSSLVAKKQRKRMDDPNINSLEIQVSKKSKKKNDDFDRKPLEIPVSKTLKKGQKYMENELLDIHTSLVAKKGGKQKDDIGNKLLKPPTKKSKKLNVHDIEPLEIQASFKTKSSNKKRGIKQDVLLDDDFSGLIDEMKSLSKLKSPRSCTSPVKSRNRKSETPAKEVTLKAEQKIKTKRSDKKKGDTTTPVSIKSARGSIKMNPVSAKAAKVRKQILDKDIDQSHDFEDVIAAAVVNKLTKKSATFVASTPVKSVGYEDAFRYFLAKSLSDTEGCKGDSDSEVDIGKRKRTKSLSSDSRIKKLSKSKNSQLKKSVSWAEGLDVLEYIQEDSDDSEIMTPNDSPVKKRRPGRPPKPKGKGTLKNSGERIRSSSVSPRKGSTKKVSASPKLELIILLERNITIETMCEKFRKIYPSHSRSMRRSGMGYKELLEMAANRKNI